ncbi:MULTISPECIES: helix-turn-helix transcriptional regulator [unclassified Beijerinckia]|uniref:AraC family transcriptional regulator n=1 Tax=unclassified Beijerinckia TaxID=2638183 RepID=UPI00089B2649|nr:MULTISPECIES: helix-turn-helix transcriptional regulator [unclassified Beijerinckia]MDH7795106.1 AraC-like DNA-binding protein [Beijerinckia sp. GAS462]SEB87790.1 transcriptional regulator, AraC family [Beijerinckia sp. 28-YEA-48]
MTDLSFDPALVNSAAEPFLIVAAGKVESERTSIPHAHARGQLFGSTNGVLTVGVVDSVWIVPAIHAVWLPPYHEHWAASHGSFEGWSVYIAESLCLDLPKTPRALRTSGLLREAVLRAASWPVAPLDAASARLATVILDEIRTLPTEALGLPMPKDNRLARIARALIDDPADGRDLEGWARWTGASSRTLSRLFVAETGFTFTVWRQRARLLRSLEMLAADVPVTSVALDLGYSTASAFITLFRQTFGETPASYQRKL